MEEFSDYSKTRWVPEKVLFCWPWISFFISSIVSKGKSRKNINKGELKIKGGENKEGKKGRKRRKKEGAGFC